MKPQKELARPPSAVADYGLASLKLCEGKSAKAEGIPRPSVGGVVPFNSSIIQL